MALLPPLFVFPSILRIAIKLQESASFGGIGGQDMPPLFVFFLLVGPYSLAPEPSSLSLFLCCEANVN
ncbi:hypothetical protein HPP92_021159 [Vanilla planifolia]|uniref:Uncharacterized protein n=1 Tax=Vanilla planifolia TaxID=51239 RepID=A0A835UII2_VANPL|nr:hypothetical protein HPP92_021516 [Vanilla planifolia]KAG0462683.1 hypothetical protein HPP92_021159 [Vanilla planifolia]